MWYYIFMMYFILFFYFIYKIKMFMFFFDLFPEMSQTMNPYSLLNDVFFFFPEIFLFLSIMFIFCFLLIQLQSKFRLLHVMFFLSIFSCCFYFFLLFSVSNSIHAQKVRLADGDIASLKSETSLLSMEWPTQSTAGWFACSAYVAGPICLRTSYCTLKSFCSVFPALTKQPSTRKQ